MTFLEHRQFDTSPLTKRDKQNNILLVIILLILIGSVYYSEIKRRQELEETKYTWGVVTSASQGKNGRYLKCYYQLNGKTIQTNRFPTENCSNSKKIGDTIIINYSLKNAQTVALKECYWNEKLKKKYGYSN